MSISDTVTARARPGGSVARLAKSVFKNAMLAVAISGATATAVSAETLLMPKRDYLMGASEVVWGITTQANGSAYTLNYGDGSPNQSGTVTDRSYIAFNHTYATSGTFTVTLTVGAESATTTVNVYNSALLSAADLRGLNINRAIENGLRYLWTAQSQRTNFDTNPQTSWDGSYPRVGTSLAVLAFENHGYVVPNDNSTPTGIYAKYAVQRGLNFRDFTSGGLQRFRCDRKLLIQQRVLFFIVDLEHNSRPRDSEVIPHTHAHRGLLGYGRIRPLGLAAHGLCAPWSLSGKTATRQWPACATCSAWPTARRSRPRSSSA